MGIAATDDLDSVFVSVDTTSTGANTVYTPPASGSVTQALVYGVYTESDISTGALALEVTDGSTTIDLSVPGAGNEIAFGNTVALNRGDTLQINVVTSEAATTTNAVAFVAERK